MYPFLRSKASIFWQHSSPEIKFSRCNAKVFRSSLINFLPFFVSCLISMPWKKKYSEGQRFLDAIAFPSGVTGPVLFCQGCQLRINSDCLNRASSDHLGIVLNPVRRSKSICHQPFDTRSRPSAIGTIQPPASAHFHSRSSLAWNPRCRLRDRQFPAVCRCQSVDSAVTRKRHSMSLAWERVVPTGDGGAFSHSGCWSDAHIQSAALWIFARVSAVEWAVAAYF